jgi:hypothetical protein
VVAAGLALLAARAWWAHVLGGLLLGFALYLSYGFVLVGLLALAVVALRPTGRLATLARAATGVVAVVVGFTAAGFWWLDGYHLVVRRYYQGWAADRPYGYWVWANLAALAVSAGPAAAPALRRVAAEVWAAARDRVGPLRPVVSGAVHSADSDRQWDGWLRRVTVRSAPPRTAVTWLPLAATAIVLLADLSGLSKAEVERIWLPFAVWLLVATARLPAADRRWWLAGQAATAIAVNHLLWTVS